MHARDRVTSVPPGDGFHTTVAKVSGHLDEANSMNDLEGETDFVEACAQSLKGRTVILISHRKATLALFDRIVRLEGGVTRKAA